MTFRNQDWPSLCPWLATLVLGIRVFALERRLRLRPNNRQRGIDDQPVHSSISAAHGQKSAFVAAVELGGTTCVAAIAPLQDITQPVEVHEFPTATPEDTVPRILSWLKAHQPFVAIGIASFGPIDLNPQSATYGYVTTTPKPNWQHFPLVDAFRPFHVPIGFDTDVNAPALAELAYASHSPQETSCAYITVGTGIGVGLVLNGGPVHGLMHPEGGHIMPYRSPGDTYEGFSPLHTTSVESMSSAQACAERLGVTPVQLPDVSDDHTEWDHVAYYLAQLCLSITYIASPHFIVLSGGVMQRKSLFPRIREHFVNLNEGYVDAPQITNAIDTYIRPSSFGNTIGIIGALELGRRALETG